MPHAMEILARDNKQGVPIWFLGALSMIKFTAEQTGGAFSLIEDILPPGRDTPYHVHHHDDETFFMLEGHATFFSGEKRIEGGPGSTIFLPREIPHGFKATTAARILIMTTPGGFDRFVVEAGEPAAALTLPPPREPDFQRLTTLAAKYGIDILGPLPE